MNNKEISSLGIEDLKDQREKTISRMGYYEGLYRAIRDKIDDAKRRAHTEKKFLPPSELRNLENKAREYNDEIQRLQRLSGSINSEIKKRESFILERIIVDICKSRLSHDTWSEILDEAKYKIANG